MLCTSFDALKPLLFNLPSVQQHLQSIVDGHATLSERLTQLTTENGAPNEIASISRRLAKVAALTEVIHARDKALEAIAELQDMLKTEEDSELRELAASDLAQEQTQLQELEQELLQALVPEDTADEASAVVELRAGTGGREAALFAHDLKLMYQGLAQQQRWSFKVLDEQATDDGGLREASLSISGSGVFGMLKFESGVHRVQRIPTTETAGRIHTSTATVAVLPEPTDVEVEVLDKDIHVETYRAGGAGGQHVNTTDSAVRLTHLPTGTVVACQTERSQHKLEHIVSTRVAIDQCVLFNRVHHLVQNKAAAMKVLKARIFAQVRAKQEEERRAARREQISTTPGERSDRIRTYNMPQDRVTDHRIKASLNNVETLLKGISLPELIVQLQQFDNSQRLADLFGDEVHLSSSGSESN
ncbi:uncharacterized protein MONBRDRAFT_22719 [Monosiga brevicollis MX1]|uniref:Prokaryotic-type class I peptide chain release factors domain-containing protein n=1 Tax=Monosiga brevicollis TaxID=81824 RepID=A9URV7_MONBE|nr:uncharacterized protein MONBRDRAFT_22719 [Monosiga brevicollis MX1]EDQ91672.1 predicted protein [Monosiga brevicollis MX1]|eukprot:XP_001742958.1 hypothetical protein [Monosiga brevicollis MX1]